MEHLTNDHEDHCNQQENSHKLCDEMRHPILSLLESQWILTTWSEFLNGGKAIVEQILASEERNKFKRAGLSQSDILRKVDHLSKAIWDRKIKAESPGLSDPSE